MQGISRVGVDKAGGTIVGALAPTVLANGVPVTVLGAPVIPHGRGPHGGPVMVTASANVFANGIPVCKAGDVASCGHATSGSGNVNVN
jgi:uncharacterized Zn-binding protein involved in type VI secretion